MPLDGTESVQTEVARTQRLNELRDEAQTDRDIISRAERLISLHQQKITPEAIADYISGHRKIIEIQRKCKIEAYLRHAARLYEVNKALRFKGAQFLDFAEAVGIKRSNRSTSYDLIKVHNRVDEIRQCLANETLPYNLETIIEFATGREPRQRTQQREQAKASDVGSSRISKGMAEEASRGDQPQQPSNEELKAEIAALKTKNAELQERCGRSLYGLRSRSDGVYATPNWFFDILNARHHFVQDLMADATTAKVKDCFITEEMDVFRAEWRTNGSLWVNPPFRNRLIYHLLSKMRDHCREHNITGVALVPVWTATTWFQEIAVEAEIRFLPDLLSFGEHQNSFPTPLCTLTFTGMSHLLRQQNLKMFDFGLRKPAKRVQVNDLYCTAI